MIGFIYKITSASTDKIYIGSTTETIKKRFKHHKYTDGCSSRLIISYGDAVSELIEEYEYEDVINLRKRERYYIELNRDICVNISTPTIDLVESKAKYYVKHIEEIKQYRSDNADKIAEVKRKWYEKNQERIAGYKERRNRQILCECGEEYSYSNKKRHMKSVKHLNYLSIL